MVPLQFSYSEDAGGEDEKWLYFITGCLFGAQTVLATLLALAELWLYIRVRSLYNGSAGNKMEDAKADIVKAAIKQSL